MRNEIRGEATLNVRGKEYTLCLSLGAMAMLQSELNIEDFSKIGTALQKPNADTIGKVILALAHGGGHEELTLEDVIKWPVGLPVLMATLKEAMSMGDQNPDGSAAEGN